MTDGQQIALAIAPTVLPTLTVLVGILLNNRQIDALRCEMNHRFDAVNREMEITRQMLVERMLSMEAIMDAGLKHLEEQRGR